jgi:ATP-dependent Clp protease protease subunit
MKIANLSTQDEMNFGVDSILDLNLMGNHAHIISGEIDEVNMTSAIKWLITENLDISDNNKILTIYINSIGGSLTDAFGLIDMMRSSRYPIRVIGIGNVMSAAFLIFAAGTKGERFIGKHTSIMCHQFSGDVFGKFHDLKAQLRETDKTNERMVELLQECTGLPNRTIKSKLLPPSDVWLTAEELVELGVADQIL